MSRPPARSSRSNRNDVAETPASGQELVGRASERPSDWEKEPDGHCGRVRPALSGPLDHLPEASLIAAGLTGGIASGKSTVSRFFAVLGARIIDADLLAREVVEPGQPAYDEILSVFGPSIALADGRLDRLQLGRLVFADPRKRKRLEAIVHPRVFQRSFAILDEIEGHTPDCVAILDIPLLFEAGMDRKLSEIIVVYVPEKLQLERLVRRDGLTRIEAMRRIRSQLPIEDKRRRATMLIDNSGRPEETQRAVRAIYGTLHRRALLFRP